MNTLKKENNAELEKKRIREKLYRQISKIVKTQKMFNKVDLKGVLYRKTLKKYIDVYSTNTLGISNSTTESFIYKDVFKSSRILPNINKYTKGDMKHYDCFVKITRVVKEECGSKIKECPNFKEIELFGVTNSLMKQNVLDTFVYCFNKEFLNKDYATYRGMSYSMLVTEMLNKDYMEIYMFLKQHKTVPDCVLYELVYTLHTMNLINMKHFDLHGGNIYVKKLPKTQHKMVRYDAIVNNMVIPFYVLRTHSVKIIDLDSGHKGKPVYEKIKNEFQGQILNPYKSTENSEMSDARTNTLKLVHTLSQSAPTLHMFDKLRNFGLRSNTKVPFELGSSKVSTKNYKYNLKFATNYGMFINKNKNGGIKFLKIDNSIVWSAEKILFHMYKTGKFQQVPVRYNTYFSQVNLFN
jgi:hypothetical protein